MLDGYIPTKKVVAIVLAQGVANLLILSSELGKQAKKANEIIADQKERLEIYDETTQFLLKHADGPTLNQLNENLDFWRVVRGKSVR